mmetsp:Transcript_64906/g.141451  ORF Transcript_64906/g.141451 Transcript_64906/m.141451 type:complete len:208 (-) Transcript_64906:312-935(-)|eukprot:CAMPEP_0170634542 /NCGR_PEP_ID=MMETSP0224-20130122/36669_1 /TAXON_ID=285029 /ORGANISM="Togula jolla, Strain CCCM 725" /LENGTH=207 /DNA_ID=CAMNT_0010963833 /DNA_START=53 /DNA_END=676 /DNA_ORIENTATION=+
MTPPLSAAPLAPVKLPSPSFLELGRGWISRSSGLSGLQDIEDLRPLLVVCHGDPLSILPQNAVVKKYFDGVLCFPTATSFTRWLFAQDRGGLRPWCVLLAGWREARPCAAAIAAARGEPRRLRYDAKRPELRAPLGGACAGEVNAAVGPMLLFVSGERQVVAATEWASNSFEAAGLQLQIASSDGKVAESLVTFSEEMTVRVIRVSF